MPIPRSKTSSGVRLKIGEPRPQPTTSLPTRRDVLRFFTVSSQYFNQKYCEEKVLRDDKDPSAKYFALSVPLQVTAVRDRVSLPVIDKYKIRERVMQEHEEFQALNNRYTYTR